MGCIVGNGIMKSVAELEKELATVEHEISEKIKRAVELDDKIAYLKSEALHEFS